MNSLENQIRKYLTNVYLWLITKLKLRIAMQEVYTRLFNLYKQHLTSFAGFCQSQSHLGNFIKLLNSTDNNVEFVIGDHTFGILAEAKVSQGAAIIRTYKLLGKYENYAEIKTKYIPELDIVLNKYGLTRFAVSKPVEGSFGVTTDMAQITDFSVQYFNAVMEYVSVLETAQIKSVNVQEMK